MKIVTCAAILVITVCATVMAVSSSQAFQRGQGCNLQQTSDGFVALRKGPSVNTGRIRKLNAAYHRVYPYKRNAKWIYVDVFTPDDYDAPANQNFNGTGYIRSDLINWSTCSNAG